MRKYYYNYRNERRAYRCARYALKEPTLDQKQAYVKEIQKELLQNKVARNELVQAFKDQHASVAALK